MIKDEKNAGKIFIAAAIVLFLLSSKVDLPYVDSIALILLVVGIVSIRKSKKKDKDNKTSPYSNISYKSSPKAMQSHLNNTTLADIKTYVTGLNYEGRQEIIDQWKNSIHEPYDGMTNKELKEEGEGRYYKYPKDYDINTFHFQPEPTNKYDSNAIKVMHSDMGFIGYVPREDTVRIHKLLSSKTNFSVESEIYGGPYKDVDEDEVYTSKRDYHISLRINKS